MIKRCIADSGSLPCGRRRYEQAIGAWCITIKWHRYCHNNTWRGEYSGAHIVTWLFLLVLVAFSCGYVIVFVCVVCFRDIVIVLIQSASFIVVFFFCLTWLTGSGWKRGRAT
jgi:hypothetical protein